MSFSDEQKAAIVAAYLAANPTRKTTPLIVRSLVDQFGGNEAKIRAVLSRANVYIAQPKLRPKVEKDDWAAVLARLDSQPLTLENRDAVAKEIGADLGFTMSAIKDFAESLEMLPLHDWEISSRENQARRAEERLREQEAEAWRRENAPKPKPSRARKSGSGPDGCGWIAIIGIALGIVILYNMDWRSDRDKRASAICGIPGVECTD